MNYQAIRKFVRDSTPGEVPCDPQLPPDPVPLADFYTIVGDTLNLDPLGFHEESLGRWMKPIDRELSHVLFIAHANTGDRYELMWGVDLVQMPRARRDTPDLFESVYDYVLTSRRELERVRSYQISAHHGCACVAHDSDRVWRLLRPIVFAWWEGTKTLADVAVRADRQSRRNWVGAAHNPDPAAVDAFIRERGCT